MCAQFGGAFVCRETGRIGGDFKQHAAGFTKVNRAKIIALHNRTYVAAQRPHFGQPERLRRIVGNAPRDVMHDARRHASTLQIGPRQHVHATAGLRAVADDEALPLAFAVGSAPFHDIAQKPRRAFGVVFGQLHAMKTA